MMKFSFFSRIKEFAANARKKSKGITLGEFIRSYAEARHKEGEKMYEGRCGSILSMLKHLETFGGSDIPLKKVDVETIKQFIDYLRSAHDLHKSTRKTIRQHHPSEGEYPEIGIEGSRETGIAGSEPVRPAATLLSRQSPVQGKNCADPGGTHQAERNTL